MSWWNRKRRIGKGKEARAKAHAAYVQACLARRLVLRVEGIKLNCRRGL